jgi:hypothetical protein
MHPLRTAKAVERGQLESALFDAARDTFKSCHLELHFFIAFQGVCSAANNGQKEKWFPEIPKPM